MSSLLVTGLLVNTVAELTPVVDDVICPAGENEAADEAAADSPRSSRAAPCLDGARRRLGRQHAVPAVQLRVLAPTGLRRADHDRLHDVRPTAASQRQDQGSDAAVRPAVVVRGRPGRGRRKGTLAASTWPYGLSRVRAVFRAVVRWCDYDST